jgi:hypothetical protein
VKLVIKKDISLMGQLEDIEIEYLTTQEERDKKLNNIGL